MNCPAKFTRNELRGFMQTIERSASKGSSQSRLCEQQTRDNIQGQVASADLRNSSNTLVSIHKLSNTLVSIHKLSKHTRKIYAPLILQIY